MIRMPRKSGKLRILFTLYLTAVSRSLPREAIEIVCYGHKNRLKFLKQNFINTRYQET